MTLWWSSGTLHPGISPRTFRAWTREHNGRVRRDGQGVRLITTDLPVHAFWLNPVEPIIKHTKDRVLPCRQFASKIEQQASIDRYWLHRNLQRATVPKLHDLFMVLH